MDFIADLDEEQILEKWATGEEDLPLYAKASRPLMEMIGKVRFKAGVKIQRLVHLALEEKAGFDNDD